MAIQIVEQAVRIDSVDFERDVREYQRLEQKVSKDFTQNLIKLGGLLNEMREKWKPQRKWGDYVNKVAMNLDMANQIIRIYEYSLDNMETLIASDITNWKKLNTFLSLPEPARLKVSELIEGKTVNTQEFNEIAGKVVDELETDVEDKDPVSIADDTLHIDDMDTSKLKELIGGSSLADIHFMAKNLLKVLKGQGIEMSNDCIPIVEGFLSLVKATKDLSPENFKKLSKAEDKFWNDAIQDQLSQLSF